MGFLYSCLRLRPSILFSFFFFQLLTQVYMTMQTISFKEQEGIVSNGMVTSGPWWSALGSQSTYGESYGQSNKLLPIGLPRPEDQLIVSSKPVGRGCTEEIGSNKVNATQFSIFPGDGQKHQTTLSLQECRPRFELGFGQPMIYAKHPQVDQCYGIFSYGSQISGRIMLPLNMTTDDGPIYVNPKQYHGILKRRQSRAKAAVLGNKLARPRKPYMHHSRHLHAMRRPRGCGGRFLNTKKMNDNGKGETQLNRFGDRQLSHYSGSPSSELLQSKSGTLNSSKEANIGSSIISSSEVTSMYSRGELDHRFAMNIGPSVHALSDMIGSARGLISSTNWVAAANNCCNLNV